MSQHWHIAKFCCKAKVSRNRSIADIEQAAPAGSRILSWFISRIRRQTVPIFLIVQRKKPGSRKATGQVWEETPNVGLGRRRDRQRSPGADLSDRAEGASTSPNFNPSKAASSRCRRRRDDGENEDGEPTESGRQRRSKNTSGKHRQRSRRSRTPSVFMGLPPLRCYPLRPFVAALRALREDPICPALERRLHREA